MISQTLSVRPASQDDLNEIMNIEEECFSSPWPLSSMQEELNDKPWSRVCVAVNQARVVGFIIYWVVDIELHLLNIATTEIFRQRGAAKAMMKHLIKDADATGAKNVFLEVRPSNTPARSLYKNLGFTDLGVRPKYYADNGEDAIVMGLELSAC